MGFDYSSAELRKQILDELKSQENIDRKTISLAQFEILNDRLLDSVTEYLRGFYSEDTLKEMPIFGSINLAKRIIENEAAIYDIKPERKFVNVSEEQAKMLQQIYDEMCIDSKMKKANKYFKLQQQTHVNVIPRKGKLKLRALLAHQLDVVPSPEDPETADAYILNGFDKSLYAPRLKSSDSTNQTIADQDDYKSQLTRMALWSETQNFIMDEKGAILSEDLDNPIGIMPFVEISEEKDHEYWIESGCAVTDFTIQWNASISDLAHIVRMQGFAQAVIKGAAGMIPERIQIGPSFVIKLPINPAAPVETDFGFANPSPDVDGSIRFVEMLLSAFLTSRGMDPKLVNTKGDSKSYSSGFEKLLSMLDAFAPSKADFDLFKKAEKQIFDIVRVYLNTYQNSDVLSYKTGQIPEDAYVEVQFSEPQMIQSEAEKLSNIREKRDLGLQSRVQALMQLYGISKEAAEELATKIDDEDLKFLKKVGLKPEAVVDEDEEQE